MCGRYGLALDAEQIADVLELDVSNLPEIAPRYNIAPTQQAPVIGADKAGGRGLSMLRWGLIPWWAKDKKIGARFINARSETLLERRPFREAFEKRRCLVPADGFYEWQKLPVPGSKKPRKQPWFLQHADGAPFVFAGLYERWWDPETNLRLFSFTIVTTRANELVGTLHDRMPVILPRETWGTWLDREAGPADVTELMQPYPAERMDAWPITTLVNSYVNDDPRVRDPLEEAAATP